jgi:hypothetical protein
MAAVVRRIHRIGAIIFVLTIPPAWIASANGDPANPSFWVYLPLIPLLGLTITGIYQLVLPWVRRSRA